MLCSSTTFHGNPKYGVYELFICRNTLETVKSIGRQRVNVRKYDWLRCQVTDAKHKYSKF